MIMCIQFLPSASAKTESKKKYRSAEGNNADYVSRADEKLYQRNMTTDVMNRGLYSKGVAVL